MKFKILLMAILVTVFFSCNQDNNQVNDGQKELKVEVLKAPNGKVTGAWYKANDGSIVEMKIIQNPIADNSDMKIIYSKSKQKLLTLEFGKTNTSDGLGIIYSSAVGIGVNYRLEMDATNVNLNNKSSFENINVAITMNGESWTNTFNFRTLAFAKNDTPYLKESIPNETALIIAPFDTVLIDIADNAAAVQGENVNDIFNTSNFETKSACTAGCWIYATAWAATCCDITIAGCPVCVAVGYEIYIRCVDGCN